MRKLFRIISINIIVFIFIALSIELIVRLSYPRIQLQGTDRDFIEENKYGNTPGLKANSNGYSNEVIKEVDTHGFWKYNSVNKSGRKVLLLGDSVTMGIGVESDSTFASKIMMLRNDIRIYNPSLIGYSSQDYLNIIKHLINSKQSELSFSEVSIVWCLNDVYGRNEAVNIGYGGESIIDRFFGFVRSNIKTFHLLKKIFFDRPKVYYDYDKKFYLEENEENEENEEIEKAVRNLTEIDTILEENLINLKIILLPYEVQLRKQGDNLPQKILIEYLEKHKISVYDLYDSIIKSGYDSEDLYLFGDGIHFSKLGHDLISKIMVKEIYLD